MTKDTDLRSVRVEVDAESGGTLDAPEVERSVDGSKVAVVLGVCGLGLVAFLVALALLADQAPPSDTDSAAPTPTPVARPLEADSRDGSDALIAGGELGAELFEQTSGSGQLQSVVRAEVGFLGLSWGQSAQQLPNLVHSADGIDWSAVEVGLEDPATPARLEGPFERLYEQLIRTDDGYALLMTTILYRAERDVSPSAARIERLTSVDGASWSIDPSFAPVDMADTFPRVVSHGVHSFTFLAEPTSPVNVRLTELIDDQMGDGSTFDDLCWADGQADGRLLLSFCTSSDTVLLDAADTNEPDRFGRLSECAVLLSQDGSGEASFWVAHRGLSARQLAGASFLPIRPSVADDGTVVAIDLSTPLWLDQSACVEFLGVDDVEPPAVVVSDPRTSTEATRHPIPEEIDPISLLSVRAEPAITGRAMLLLIGSSVTSIDIDSGEWTEALRLPFRVDDETAVRFTVDGSQLIQLDSSRVTVVDLQTGAARSRVDVGGGNRPGFPWMLYADDEVVFAQGGNSMFSVNLPTN